MSVIRWMGQFWKRNRKAVFLIVTGGLAVIYNLGWIEGGMAIKIETALALATGLRMIDGKVTEK